MSGAAGPAPQVRDRPLPDIDADDDWGGDPPVILGEEVDLDALEEAAHRLRRGEVAEALRWIERSAPYAFGGLATAAVPAAGRR